MDCPWRLCLRNHAAAIEIRALCLQCVVHIFGRAWPATVLNRIRLRPAPGRQVLEQAAAEIGTGGSPDFMMCVAVALPLPRQTGICHMTLNESGNMVHGICT